MFRLLKLAQQDTLQCYVLTPLLGQEWEKFQQMQVNDSVIFAPYP